MNWKLWIFLVWCSLLIVVIQSQTCPMEIQDRLWQNQWYLKRTDGYDMNVMPAWESCVNGTGITVGVVDKGVQDHIDLNIVNNNNYRYHYWDYRVDTLKHGTRIAGIIAATKNSIGLIGIAFGALIKDIKIASTSVFETFNASLLRQQSDNIDVYSCSFANFHTGTNTFPLLQDQEEALSQGTTHGRNGRGSVYVFGSGNSGGGTVEDSCAYDRLVTNRYVISVAGVQHNLKKLPNGEACSGMMVAAFTAKGGERHHRIVTTDVRNGYTYYFNQNSAAVPMVSGAVALALSANQNLTYRDVMHLIVETSRNDFMADSFKSTFTKNAANLSVSSYFGFGLLDIGALVERSKTWTNVPPRTECSQTVQLNAPLQRSNNLFVVQIYSCSVSYMEHVDVTLRVNHESAGRIKWVLISPYGTRSTILPGRALDTTKSMIITVLSVQMWGENPNGFWRLEPKSVFGSKLADGTLESVGIKIHGYSCSGSKCIDRNYQEQGIWGAWTIWSSCSTTCGLGVKRRQRTCYSHAVRQNIDVYCEGSNVEQASCREIPCPVETHLENHILDSWSTWSSCKQDVCTCEPGTKTRTRVCLQQSGHQVKPCVNYIMTKKCNLPDCQHGVIDHRSWGRWTSWTRCRQTCGSETRTRKRSCWQRQNNQWEKFTDDLEREACMLPDCFHVQTNHQAICGIVPVDIPCPTDLYKIQWYYSRQFNRCESFRGCGNIESHYFRSNAECREACLR